MVYLTYLGKIEGSYFYDININDESGGRYRIYR